MANILTGFYKRFNGTDWDTVYFKAPASVISETDTRKWLTDTQQTALNTYLFTFNQADKLVKLDNAGKIPSGLLDFTIGDYLKRTGGTMLGAVNMDGYDIQNAGTFNASSYIIGTTSDTVKFSNASNKLKIFGDGIVFDSNSAIISNLDDPVSAKDAANKQYVDQLVAVGTRSVESVKAATVSNISSLSDLIMVDGYQLQSNDRILVKNQSTASQNGIYVAKSGAWTKVTEDSQVGGLVFVEHGMTNNDSTWMTKVEHEWLKFSQVDLHSFGDGLTQVADTVVIETGGVLNKHISNSAGIALSKLGNVGATSDTSSAWTDMFSLASTNKTITEHLSNIYKTLKRIRGTADYNTTNLQHISGAYYLAGTKNRTFKGTAAPSNDYVNGDIYIHHD